MAENINYISAIKLSIKNSKIKKDAIFVRSMRAEYGNITLALGNDIIPDIGSIQIDGSHWGTVDNEYIYGFAYASVMPSV